MLSGLTDVSLPDASSLTDRVSDLGSSAGLLGVGVGVAAGVAVAPAAPLASVLLPTVASLYIEEGADRLADVSETRLRAIADQYDDPQTRRQAALAKCSGAACKALDPIVPADADADAARELAAADPERFQTLLQQVFESDPETLQQIEDDLQQLFAADPDTDDTDPETVVQRVQDTFDVDSTQEAIRLLQMHRTFLDDVGQTAADQTDDPEVHATVENLNACLESMDDNLRDVLDALLGIELEDNQGFSQWTIGTLDRRQPDEGFDPRGVWGFGRLSLVDLVAADSAEYDFEVGDIKTDSDDTPFRRQVFDDLDSQGDPIVLTAGPECGKSTVCKRVAYDWVDRDRGTVFYRGQAAKPFDGEQALLTAIEEAQDIGEGTPLVVVEDATRQSANAIFDVIHRCRTDRALDVAFLLDARTSEWERFEQERHPDRIINPDFGESPLEVRELPELSVATCREARAAFNQLPGAYYHGDADSLYQRVTEATPSARRAYEFSTMSTELRERGLDTEGTPFADSASGAYETFVGPVESEIDGIGDIVDPTDTEPEAIRRALVAVGLNLLNAVEYPVEPELLFGIGLVSPTPGEVSREEMVENVGAMLDCLTDSKREGGFNQQIVRTDSTVVTLAPLETRPPSWSARFLEHGMTEADDHVLQLLLTVAGAAMAGLAGELPSDIDWVAGSDGRQRRAMINEVLQQYSKRQQVTLPDGNRYLRQLDQEPAASAADVLARIYEWAERGLRRFDVEGSWRRELLRPDISPSQSSTEDEFDGFGDGFGETDETEPRLHDAVPRCCSETLEYDLRTRLVWGDGSTTALERLDELDRERRAAETPPKSRLLAETCLTIGSKAVDEDTAREAFGKALDLFESLDAHDGVAQVYTELGKTYEDRDKETAERHYENAIEHLDPDSDPRFVGVLHLRIARLHGRADPAVAENHYDTAITQFDAVDDHQQVGEVYRELASLYKDVDDEAAEAFEKKAIDRFEAIDNQLKAAQAYRELAWKYDKTDTEAADRYYAKAIDCLHSHDGDTDYPLALVYKDRAGMWFNMDLERATAEEYYLQSIDYYERVDADNDIGTVYETMASMFRDTDKEHAEHYYREAIDKYDRLNNDQRVADACRDIGKMYHDTDTETAEENYREAIGIFEEISDDWEVGRTYQKMAAMYEDSDRETATQYYLEAIDAFDSVGNDNDIGATYRDMAQMYKDTDKETAKRYYKKAIEHFESTERDHADRRSDQMFEKLARMYEDTDRQAAERYYEELIDRCGDDGHAATAYERLARLNEDTDKDAARKYYRKGVQRAPTVGRAIELQTLRAEFEIASGDPQTAAAIAEESIQMFTTAVSDNEIEYMMYRLYVDETVSLLETVARAVQSGGTLPPGFIKTTSELLAATEDEIPETTREEFRAAIAELKKAS